MYITEKEINYLFKKLFNQYLLESGTQLVSTVEHQKHYALNELFVAEWGTEFPQGGFHLDLTSKTLEFWLTSSSIDIVNRIQEYWQGWNIIFHSDNFEFQVKKTNHKLRFPQSDNKNLRENIEKMLLREKIKNPVDGLLELTERDRAEGKEVEINPWVLRNDRLELNIEQKQEILNRAFDCFFDQEN